MLFDVGVLLIASFICIFLLATLAAVYLWVLKPLRHTAEWIRHLRLGHSHARLTPAQQKLLGPLASEISQLTQSLVAARASAEREARLRLSSESIWTAERLKEFVRIKLQNRPLLVVSNREPYQHVYKNGNIECRVPPSGLVTAIEPVLKACGGVWVAQASGDADRQASDANGRVRVPPEEPQYTLKRVWLTEEEEKGHYYGFSNEGLWPLCHIAHTRPVFREQDWNYYKSVNEKFLNAILEELEDVAEPFVLVQDYHFALLPEMIKARRPDARIAIFWHIPWPNPESFGICPWQKELLNGMLGADLVCFHTQYHCNNFVESVDRFMESRIDYDNFSVHRENRTTWVKPFPISIAFTEQTNAGATVVETSAKKDLLKPFGFSAEFIGVGVDRLDYTKGILERFSGIEAFLKKNPQYRGRLTFVELGAPSRTQIPKYQEFDEEIDAEVQRINDRFKDSQYGNWRPIVLLKKQHTQADIAPFYKYSDFCMVTSLHDGMNLVAKEFVAARTDREGVLILSQFTGVAREFRDALIINPYDIGQMADAIGQALKMSPHEQKERMDHMRGILKERNIYRWAADLVGELTRIRVDAKEEVLL